MSVRTAINDLTSRYRLLNLTTLCVSDRPRKSSQMAETLKKDIPDDTALDALAKRLGDVLHRQHQMLVTAESCTGGWVAKVLTDIPGSSAWFDRGFVTYTNQAKQDMLGVPAVVLENHGAVSEQTVQAMVRGGLNHSQADFSLAISGIAGPGGGTADKPVGLVCFGWAQKREAEAPRVWSTHCLFSGDRDAVRRQAVATALQELLDDIAPT
jgi:nicotinamide-nucleotide amidase